MWPCESKNVEKNVFTLGHCRIKFKYKFLISVCVAKAKKKTGSIVQGSEHFTPKCFGASVQLALTKHLRSLLSEVP